MKKNIWILEAFTTKEESEKLLQEYEGMREKMVESGDEEDIAFANRVVENHKRKMAENPDGYWSGYQGKFNYKVFCWESKQTMRNLKGKKFRVLKAEIDSECKTWLGNYKNGVENVGVLRYLYATM